MARNSKAPKQVETLTHDAASRKNIPTAELQSIAERMEEAEPFEPVTYKRANPLAEGETRERDEDLDPQIIWKGTEFRLTNEQIETLKTGGKVELGEAQLIWRGKDQQDWSDLVVQAPPIFVQEKIHPKAIIEDLKKQTKARKEATSDAPDLFDLFGDFNGIDPEAKTEFYQHNQHWQNRMILGDGLQVMASLAERENLRGKVRCIYFDPPYGIKFNSNWQVSTRNLDVDERKMDHVTREPEQVKAFRDTWKDGVHSYLTYLRDRLTAMRDLLMDNGSIFVQIGDENVHRVRALMDEVFGEKNFLSLISIQTTSGFQAEFLGNMSDFVLWYARDKDHCRTHTPFYRKSFELGQGNARWLMFDDFSYRGVTAAEKRKEIPVPSDVKPYKPDNIISQGRAKDRQPFTFRGKTYDAWDKNSHWKANYPQGMERLAKAARIHVAENSIQYVRYHTDFDVAVHGNIWTDTGTGNFTDDKIYVVQTNTKVIERCILMATDPGDLVLDPTCGSGTTATVAEQWGRRWITVDTSRVALALARSRIMGARYPYYFLADSVDGREKEADISGVVQSEIATHNDIRQGFVYERAPHIMLKTIANDTSIDVIWDKWQEVLEPLRTELNATLDTSWEEWEIPREQGEGWSEGAKKLHSKWWEVRIKRQKEIDTSIAQKADVEYLYDRPYEDSSKVRVAGPFTVESLSPHRVIPADESELIDDIEAAEGNRPRTDAPAQDFATMVLENLKSAGVHQADKQDRIAFTAMEGWPGDYIAATGTYEQDGNPKKAAIFIGPEFGSISRSNIMAAAREANDARFDVLIACGFNFDAHSSEINKLGPLPILKAKMNPDLHMADDLKNTGAGNLFVVFGEPDIEWNFDDDGKIVVEVLGIDVFDPKTGDVRASGKDDIAAWFIDTDYNEESFFVRHAYFMGANDPYKALKTSLKAEIDPEAWATLYRDTSRPFDRPATGRFAVKVINHFGDEVMKVFGV
ncbi:site-specific DNA-methyltransferase [Sneathiella chinensis]|uniref:site-specific DNA-methyltransferase (adenine-specific) n=1 Tax=Sneathiella chinensis TaxID=349750 RepID=A0ABQ5U131_9PROT|nr:site-specific DNA-methyltransferase [Sneathiella chinensis]GLQ05865.1 site-specific DNA-methyltransferase [Sneathiella chinensis]